MEKREYIYPGSVDEFRAEMDFLRNENPNGWEANGGARVNWREWPLSGVSTRGTWTVGSEGGHAVIEAYQKRGQTVIVFADGYALAPYTYRKRPAEPIGSAFEEFTRMIVIVTEMKPRPAPTEDGVGKRRGPTIKTRERAKVFKQLKDAHPEWSYDKVALEAIEELGEVVTGEAVRNAYRAMGWKWERADRVR